MACPTEQCTVLEPSFNYAYCIKLADLRSLRLLKRVMFCQVGKTYVRRGTVTKSAVYSNHPWCVRRSFPSAQAFSSALTIFHWSSARAKQMFLVHSRRLLVLLFSKTWTATYFSFPSFGRFVRVIFFSELRPFRFRSGFLPSFLLLLQTSKVNEANFLSTSTPSLGEIIPPQEKLKIKGLDF